MNKSEIRKIRKRIDTGLSNFKNIYGCYVNAAGEIVSTMEIPVLDMEMEEREMYAALFRKGISGPKEKHIMDLEFSPDLVENSDRQKLLMAMNESRLEDASFRNVFYESVNRSLNLPDKGYAILLASDAFDIQSRFDNEEEQQSEETVTQFTYIICSICEVKNSKAMLKYLSKPKEFRGTSTGSILAAPLLGFMYPAFDFGRASIYNALFYSKDPSDNHEEFLTEVFGLEKPPMSAEMQKAVFYETLSQTLGADCNMDVVTSVQARIASTLCEKGTECSIITPEISAGEVGEILKSKGIPETKITAFEKAVEDRFGTDTVATANLLRKDEFRISSSEAEISIPPENAVRIKTKVIDGVRYFLVPVGSDVKINGVDIVIDSEVDDG